MRPPTFLSCTDRVRAVLAFRVIAQTRCSCARTYLAGALMCVANGLVCATAWAQETRFDVEPHVEPASDEGRAAMARFAIPEGFKIELFAAEPMLANPVCFYAADNGDFYVGETFRHHQGVADIRDHMDWLDDDLAAKTVEDRVAYFKKRLGEHFSDYEKACERVRLIRDTDGDGFADKATVFSDRFHGAPDGIGASLLEHHGDVYYTCIPTLWLLRDTNGDGKADVEKELSTGYGVHVALLGHDLHGLRIGPDGKLYFSIGDRGFTVTTNTGIIEHPQAGAVLRCKLDGSDLEVFATGLRNPQDLVFDAFGNLFTGDNNSDGGDRARFVHVVEGGDSGWRQSYQWVTEPVLRGPWNDEKLWIPHFQGQAAYIVPPIANLADGPSGLAINPGTGLPKKYEGHLFLCDFRGDAKSSGIHDISLIPQNASFALGPVEHFAWGSLVTDCDFGPDGALYFTDWIQGWNQTGKGRLYRVFDPASRASDAAKTTRKLLAEGMSKRDVKELASLLDHADQRVRQAAQFELVARGAAGWKLLEDAAKSASPTLTRVHGVWGLGMSARPSNAAAIDVLIALLDDKDAEVRAQSARVLGDLREPRAINGLIARLADETPRARMYAAIGLGRVRTATAVTALVKMAEEAGDTDPVLRHSASFGLAGCAKSQELLVLVNNASANVRLAAIVALRRMKSPDVGRYLINTSPFAVLEAARAIYDVPIPEAMPALAGLIWTRTLKSKDLLRRVLNANFRLGKRENAEALANYAMLANEGADLRREALDRLAQWQNPPGRDPISCAWRPLDARTVGFMPDLAMKIGTDGLKSAPAAVLEGWVHLVETYQVAEASEKLAQWTVDAKQPSSVRCASLRALAALGAPKLNESVQAALSDSDGDVRAAALDAISKISPAEALPLLVRMLTDGEMRERRSACKALGRMQDASASVALGVEIDKLSAGLFPVEIALDLVQAAEARKDAGLDTKLSLLRKQRAVDPALAPYVDSLFGGDFEAGKRIFREKAETTCLRCHKTEWDEGGNVGPDMRGVAKRLARLQILESIVQPNRHITTGYQNTVFALEDETYVDGRVVGEDSKEVRVLDAQDKTTVVPVTDIASRRPGLSAMPEGFEKYLTPSEMRSLIEYLCKIEKQ